MTFSEYINACLGVCLLDLMHKCFCMREQIPGTGISGLGLSLKFARS